MPQPRPPLHWILLLPQHWPAWVGMGMLYGLSLLPYSWLLNIGSFFGRVLGALPFRHRGITLKNLQMCFPEMSNSQRRRLRAAHFRSVGISLCETALAWWASDARLRRLVEYRGVENIAASMQGGAGSMLLVSHFTTMEITGRFISLMHPIDIVYRVPRSKVLAWFIAWRRGALAYRVIENDDIRAMVRALRNRELVWYAPDQAFRKKGAAMVRFFGVPCATNTATSRLAEATGAAVLPYFLHRLPGAAGYRAEVLPKIADFPSADAVHDAERIHALIETQVRQSPEQYLWLHRRFKSIDPAIPDPYG